MNSLSFKTEALIYCMRFPANKVRVNQRQQLGNKLICSFCCFTSQSSAMVMAGRSVHLTTLSWARAFNQYFVHILSLLTDNTLLEWFSGREENDRRNYFMINIHERMGPGGDRTCDPWICSQTRICCQTCYRLRYVAPCNKLMNKFCQFAYLFYFYQVKISFTVLYSI